MSTQLSNILKSFSKLTVGSLQQTLEHFKPTEKSVIKSAQRAELTSMMKSVICSQTYSFMEDMEKFTEIFAKGFACPEAEVLKKLELHGLYTSLEKLSQDDLAQVFKLLSLQESTDLNLSRQEMIGKIEEECFLQGVNKLLIKMCEGGSAVLKSYCTDLKMKYIDGDDSKNAEEVMKSMFDLESDLAADDAEEEEEDAAPEDKPAPKKPAPKEKPAKKPAAPKKPAAKPASKKPAAKVEVDEDEESEEEAPKTTKAKPAAKSKAKPAASSKANGKAAAAETSGKRARKPVTKYEDEAANGSAATTTKAATTKAKAAPKAPANNKRKARDEEDETDDEEAGSSKALNPFGGYRDKDGKYISPPVSKIVKGVTKDQLHDFFNLEPLQEFCKIHDIPFSAYKKSQLTKVIADFLETNEKPLSKKEKLAKKAALKKQKTAKSSKSTNTKTPTSTTTTTSSTPAATTSADTTTKP